MERALRDIGKHLKSGFILRSNYPLQLVYSSNYIFINSPKLIRWGKVNGKMIRFSTLLKSTTQLHFPSIKSSFWTPAPSSSSPTYFSCYVCHARFISNWQKCTAKKVKHLQHKWMGRLSKSCFSKVVCWKLLHQYIYIYFFCICVIVYSYIWECLIKLLSGAVAFWKFGEETYENEINKCYSRKFLHEYVTHIWWTSYIQ